MSLTEQQHQDQIVLTVGDDAAGTLASNIALLWAARAPIANLDLRALRVTVDAIDIMLGRVRSQVDFRAPDGSSVSLSDLFDHLITMREAALTELAQAQAGAGGGVAIGTLTQTAPIMRDRAAQPDPNSRRLRGDPLRRIR